MFARAFLTLAYIAVMALAFYSSLPTWCDHPERPGNSVVQPLCK